MRPRWRRHVELKEKKERTGEFIFPCLGPRRLFCHVASSWSSFPTFILLRVLLSYGYQ